MLRQMTSNLPLKWTESYQIQHVREEAVHDGREVVLAIVPDLRVLTGSRLTASLKHQEFPFHAVHSREELLALLHVQGSTILATHWHDAGLHQDRIY